MAIINLKGDITNMNIDYAEIIRIFASVAIPAFGVAFVFAFGEKIVRSLLSMMLGGKFKI